MVLDGLVVGTAVLLVSWVVVLQATVESAESGWLVNAISIAYPVGDLVAISVALVVVARARHGGEVPIATLLLLAAGTMAFAVGDTGFLLLTQLGTYFSGHPVDLGWAAGFTLIGLAATVRGTASTGGGGSGRMRRLALVAPYVAVVFGMVIAMTRLVTNGSLGFPAWLLLLQLALLVIRQVLTMLENDRLTRTLEQRVTERTEQLASRERWFASLVRSSSDVILVLDPAGIIDFSTPSVERVLGHRQDSLPGTALADLLPPEDSARLLQLLARLRTHPLATSAVDLSMRHVDGSLRATETTITSLVHDPAVGGLVVTIRDVTERRVLEQQLTHQAFHDGLTSLANKALFEDRLTHALDARRGEDPLAVVFIDLDDFKSVNDSLGHGCGDELLRQVAERLLASVRPGDTVARFGGDEFAVLLEAVLSDEEAASVASRFHDSLREPFPVAGRDVLVRASVGIAVTSTGVENAEELLRNADLAMYRAKSLGKGGYQVYEHGMHTTALTRLELENDLRTALARDEFHLEYQPTVELATGRLTGVEALLRWTHPVRGPVPPADFISVAEETGLIIDIGAWVIEEACRQSARWARLHSEPLVTAINISGRQLTPALVAHLRTTMRQYGVPGSALVLEMTESVLIDRTRDVLDLLEEIREMGLQIAIDDFGTGFSSLSYLSRLPVDVLKIDRSFVEQVAQPTQQAELTRTIVRLAQNLNLRTVAEGIEDDTQLQELRAMGCLQGQGFFLARPMRAQLIEQMLTGTPLMPGAPSVRQLAGQT